MCLIYPTIGWRFFAFFHLFSSQWRFVAGKLETTPDWVNQFNLEKWSTIKKTTRWGTIGDIESCISCKIVINCEGLACETPLSYWLNLGFWMILGGVEIRLMVVAVPYLVLFSSGCSMLL